MLSLYHSNLMWPQWHRHLQQEQFTVSALIFPFTCQLRAQKMRKLWTIVFTACLFCHLARRHVCQPQILSNWEEDLGVDMCFECRPLPQEVRNTPENFHEEDYGIDMCPECRPLPQEVHTLTPENFHEEDYGIDMCPECRPLPQEVHTLTPENFREEDYGIDMCPECRSLPQEVHTLTPENFREEGYGIDMCPECRPLPQEVHTLTPENFHEEDYGIDMCPECRPLPQEVHTVTPENFHEEDYGIDMGPECRPLPRQAHTGKSASFNEEDLGMDMCPECRPLPKQIQAAKLEHSLENFHGEDLGMDMCPECRPLPQVVETSTPDQFNEDNLGVDMCPEKGQPMAGSRENPCRMLGTDSSTLVQELQQLVTVQQLQIDQLGRLLRQLGKALPTADLEVLDLPKEQRPSSRESNVRFMGDKSSEHQHQEVAPFEDLKETRKLLSSLGSPIDVKSPITPGVLASDGEAQSSGLIVAPYRPSWSEHFSFLSAVKVDGEVSCLHLLPQEGDDEGTRYVVGDVNGELHIFLWSGELILHHPTISRAPVTAMLSYTLQKTEIILVTGHADGVVLVHQIREHTEKQQLAKDDRTKIHALHSLIPPSPQSVRASFKETSNGDGRTKVSLYGREASVAVVNLESFKVGKMRYTVVVDKSGKIQLFRDNGSLHGVAQSPSQPLAFVRNPNAQRLVFLTERGVATLDLRTMQVRNRFCVDLNSSIVMAYAFDVLGRSRANGFTTEGDMVSVLLRGDMMHLECHVKKKRRLEVPGPFAALGLKGYLVAATPNHVLVFNTTNSGFSNANYWVEGPKLIFSAIVKDIALSFLKAPISQSHWPVMASNSDRFIVLGFGGGYVGVFRSNLPTKPAESSAKFWNSSILMSGLVLLAMWQLYNRRRDQVQSPSRPRHDEAEIAKLGIGDREKAVEPRRFRSPTRGYVSGNSVPFASSSRSFVRSGLDTGTYSARREPLFASSQPVGEVEQSVHNEGDILNSKGE